MATTSSCNFHPYSEACSCYRCYKSRSVMPKPDYYSYRRPYGRREADLFGEVSRGLGEPARLTSGGIRATRRHQSASEPTPLSKASTDSSMNRLEKFPSCETDDDLFDKVMRRLEPKIEILVEKAYAELLRQHRELKQENVTVVEKVEELQPLIAADSGDLKKYVEEEATPVTESTTTLVAALPAGKQQREDEQEQCDASLQHSNVAENVPVQLQQDEVIPIKPLLKIPCHSLNVNSTIVASWRKPSYSLTATTKTSIKAIGAAEVNTLAVMPRKISTQGRSRHSWPRKLTQQQIAQFKYRRKSLKQPCKLREGRPPYHQHQKSKVCRQWNRFLPLILCDLNSHTKGPKYDKKMEWITMKYEDFEDSRTNPFEEGEYDVILVLTMKLHTRRGNISWPEVLSWLKMRR